MKDMFLLEIRFPTGVEVTEDDVRVLGALAGQICDRWERAHPGRVMWPFGQGFKMMRHPAALSDDEPIPFDESCYQIEVAERAVWDWPCAKCGKEQGDHKDNITDPPAGECEFEPAKKDLGPEPVRGVVPMHVYLSAVKGRQDFRTTMRRYRDALRAILAEPHGCQFCDSGKLRNSEKPHDPNCGFLQASEALQPLT